jgi:hypothetical protein
MKCIDQMPVPIETEPPKTQSQRDAWLRSAREMRAPRSSATNDAVMATMIERRTGQKS